MAGGIENEIKYILGGTNIETLVAIASQYGRPNDITQGYIDGIASVFSDTDVYIFQFRPYGYDETWFECDIDEGTYELLTKAFGGNESQPGQNGSARIRKINGTELYFTYKTEHNDNLIEVENEIPSLLYNRFVPLAYNLVTKTRYKFKDGAILWDIDFLRDGLGYIYIGIVEAEMPVQYMEPPHLIPLVSEYTVYRVRRDDRRFTNKKLSDSVYARKLMGKIMSGTIDKGE